ncbi:Hypothetical protein GLP15_1621 [Giardia lamblia P15]|uniref:Uncharacterized protein n=1 Tax=Giardia intestinalis (strain P15) TaxID=658858 RepID=E1F7Z1_GIAIA|nr:Hypothetical protein GLP15_1621 [Giardia lamblia P15]
MLDSRASALDHSQVKPPPVNEDVSRILPSRKVQSLDGGELVSDSTKDSDVGRRASLIPEAGLRCHVCFGNHLLEAPISAVHDNEDGVGVFGQSLPQETRK